MLFFVTGLGRSGTSCIAEMLHVSGIDMGSDKTVDKLNPRGYWEDNIVAAINSDIQGWSKGSVYWWNDPNLATSKDMNMTRSRIEKFVKSRKEPFGAKDCRFASTWPIWKDVIDFNNVLFIVVRRRIDSIFKSMMRVPGLCSGNSPDNPKEEQISRMIYRNYYVHVAFWRDKCLG